MRFEIEHRMHFRYTRSVFIEPMTIRLTPYSNLRQRLLEFDLKIDAPPVGLSVCNDLEGATTHLVWFCDWRNALSIRTRAVVETLCSNPFDYLLSDPGTRSLPAAYSPELTASLAPYRGGVRCRALDALVAGLLQRTESHTLDFLLELVGELHRSIDYIERPAGAPWPAGQTLSEGCGSCRDSAVVFIEVCRCVGLAARFVSGYKQEADEAARGSLHAWAEVYLPGAGWRGYDPTLGLAVSNRHIALACAADPSLTAPTTGSYRGTGVESELASRIVIRSLDPEAVAG